MMNINSRLLPSGSNFRQLLLYPSQMLIVVIINSFSLSLAPIIYSFNSTLVTNQQVIVPGEATLWLSVADD